MRDAGLKGQDILVLLRLAVGPRPGHVENLIKTRGTTLMERKEWGDNASYLITRLAQNELAEEVGISTAEANHSVSRCSVLLNPDFTVRQEPFLDLLLYGIPYFIPAQKGAPVAGVPTAWGCALMQAHYAKLGDAPPVWPSESGEVRGMSVSPIYKSAPYVSRDHSRMYLGLAAIDLIRLGRARDVEVAMRVLRSLIQRTA